MRERRPSRIGMRLTMFGKMIGMMTQERKAGRTM
jgi:hypothetical protein